MISDIKRKKKGCFKMESKNYLQREIIRPRTDFSSHARRKLNSIFIMLSKLRHFCPAKLSLEQR